MPFSPVQVRQLRASVKPRNIKQRQIEGKTLNYVEGWHVVSEANRIFGFDCWDRETVSTECVWRHPVDDKYGAAYLTRVRVKVRAGDSVITREGLGSGEAIAATPGQAHEMASKAAETDATKRALCTFGNSFGLSLYGGKTETPAEATNLALARTTENSLENPAKSPDEANGADRIVHLPVHLPPLARGEILGPELSVPEPSPEHVGNLAAAAKTARADSAKRAYINFGRGLGVSLERTAPEPFKEAGCSEASPEASDSTSKMSGAPVLATAPPEPAPNQTVLPPLNRQETPQRALMPGRIEKSALLLGEPKRVRSRDHLQYVAKRACLVCGRAPSQAHHLRFTQPRALGRKVSDEFTVPLCALHHHELHMHGNELAWWGSKKIEPRAIAEKLWRGSRDGDDDIEDE